MSNPTTPFSWQMPTATDLVTDLPADFEVFGQAVATSMADLLGGTTGQILSKTSNTDMDFTWIANDQGDITGVTASSPLTGGGTSGAITVGIQDALTTQKGAVQLSDSTSTTSSILAATPTAVKSAYDLAAAAVPKSTVTTAGDVIYSTGSAAVTRLGIGTAGQVLQVNSGATAPEWATATSGGMTLINAGGTALSGASTSVSSIPSTYKDLVVYIESIYGASAAYPQMYFNTDSTTTNYGNATMRMAWGTGTIDLRGGNTYQLGGTVLSTGNNNNGFFFTIPDYASTNVRKSASFHYSARNSDPTNASGNGNLAWNSTAAINQITILMSTGNLSGGTIYVYGVK
jgi:hypothetical protein